MYAFDISLIIAARTIYNVIKISSFEDRTIQTITTLTYTQESKCYLSDVRVRILVMVDFKSIKYCFESWE